MLIILSFLTFEESYYRNSISTFLKPLVYSARYIRREIIKNSSSESFVPRSRNLHHNCLLNPKQCRSSSKNVDRLQQLHRHNGRRKFWHYLSKKVFSPYDNGMFKQLRQPVQASRVLVFLTNLQKANVYRCQKLYQRERRDNDGEPHLDKKIEGESFHHHWRRRL